MNNTTNTTDDMVEENKLKRKLDQVNNFKNCINTINFKNIKVDELKSISKTLGIYKSGLVKKGLYDRIINYFQLQDDIERKRIKLKSINPFNKERPQLVITQVEPVELLFWRVFRDKSLFYKIFSNFTLSKVYSYEDLYNVSSIISNYSNGANIVRDKLKCGGYLAVGSESNSELYCLCMDVKEKNKENIELYTTLFTKYKKHFDTESILRTLIYGGNKMAFKIYKQLYGIERDYEIKVLDWSHYHTAHYIASIFNKEGLDGNSNSNSNSKSNGDSNGDSDSDSNSDSEYHSLSIKVSKDDLNIFKGLKFKHFIKYLSFEILYSGVKFRVQYGLQGGIDELEQFKTQFTNEQLNGNILDLVLELNKDIKNNGLIEMIHKYIRIFIEWKRMNKSSEYYLLFNGSKTTTITSTSTDTTTTTTSHGLLSRLCFPLYLKRCQSKDERIEFTKSLLETPSILEEIVYERILIPSLQNDDVLSVGIVLKKVSPSEIFTYYISSIIKSIKSPLALKAFDKKKYRGYMFRYGSSYWMNIKSSLVLKQYEQLYLEINKQKILITNIDGENEEEQEEDALNPEHNKVAKLLYHGISNPSLYELDNQFRLGSIIHIVTNCLYFNKQNIIIKLLNSGKFNMVNITIWFQPDFGGKAKVFKRYRLSEWIYQHCKELPKLNLNNRLAPIKIKVTLDSGQVITLVGNSISLIVLLYECGKYKETYQLIQHNDPSFTQIIGVQMKSTYQIKVGAIKEFMSYYNNYPSINDLNPNGFRVISKFEKKATKLITDIVKNGNLPSFNYFVLNHPSFFNKDQADTHIVSWYLNRDQIKLLLKEALDNERIEFIPLLLTFSNIGLFDGILFHSTGKASVKYIRELLEKK